MAEKRRASILIFLILQNVVMETLSSSTSNQHHGPRYHGACLQGWGAVAGMTPAVVNRGLNRLQSRFPESMRVINSNTTSNFGIIGVNIHINNAVIGDLELSPLTNYLRVANLTVTFVDGAMIYTTLASGNIIETTPYNMAGQQIVVAVSVRSYRALIDNIGSVYKVMLYIKDNNAVQDFSIRGTAGTLELLQKALVSQLKEKFEQGTKHDIMTFQIEENDDTRAIVPRSMDFTFEYDHSGQGNHVFAALAVMPGMAIPVQPRDYIFNNEQILQPNTNLTFTFENQFLLHFLRSELGKVDSLRDKEWTVISGCPGKLALLNAESVFNDADSATFEITLEHDLLNIHTYAMKSSDGRTVEGTCDISYSISAEEGQVRVNRQVRRCNREESRAWWLYLGYAFSLGIAAAIIEDIDLDVDVTRNVNQKLSEFLPGLSFKTGGIELSRHDEVIFKTDRHGNLQIGVVVSSP